MKSKNKKQKIISLKNVIATITIFLIYALIFTFILRIYDNGNNKEVSNSQLCQSVGLNYSNGTNFCYQLENDNKIISKYRIETIGNQSYVNKLTILPSEDK